ncbi:hypothetical protein J6590_093893 [Homalodisca vitripennis]|nr:hypothetical protein J6590_093893 [Homalodisca vitripennis]
MERNGYPDVTSQILMTIKGAFIDGYDGTKSIAKIWAMKTDVLKLPYSQRSVYTFCCSDTLQSVLSTKDEVRKQGTVNITNLRKACGYRCLVSESHLSVRRRTQLSGTQTVTQQYRHFYRFPRPAVV